MSNCDDIVQNTLECRDDVDIATNNIVAMLPRGMAWDAAEIDGTVHNRFWRSIATTVNAINLKICQIIKERFCFTLIDSVDDWNTEYAIGENCNPLSLCAKISATGGSRCEYFVEMAALSGFVIECSPIPDDSYTGIMVCGCSMLPPPPVRVCEDEYAICPPENFGSPLGTTDMLCCWPVGHAEPPVKVVPSYYYGPCSAEQSRFFFECPETTVINPLLDYCTDSRGYLPYTGFSHLFEITLDVEATRILQNEMRVEEEKRLPEPSNTYTGMMVTGCDALCNVNITPAVLFCLLDAIKPAHTNYVFGVK